MIKDCFEKLYELARPDGQVVLAIYSDGTGYVRAERGFGKDAISFDFRSVEELVAKLAEHSIK